MVDLGITDLRTDPKALPPLKMLESQTKKMWKYIVESLITAGASPETLLPIYSSDRPVWEVPGSFIDNAPDGCESIACSVSSRISEEKVIGYYSRALSMVSEEGMGTPVRDLLAELFGSIVYHPYVFTPTTAEPKSVGLAAAEFALLLASRSAQTSFFKGYAFVKLHAHSFGSRMGVIDGVVVGRKEKISTELLEARLYGERGMFTYATFDIFDKIRMWSDDNYFAIPDPVHFRRVLAFLKMAQAPRLAYECEQAIYTMPDYLVSDVTLKAATYTDDALDELRNIWLLGTDPDEERYKRLYNALVPKFIDASQFLQMFKIDPQMPLGAKEIASINSGMETFIDHFLSVQIAARTGRVVI